MMNKLKEYTKHGTKSSFVTADTKRSCGEKGGEKTFYFLSAVQEEMEVEGENRILNKLSL